MAKPGADGTRRGDLLNEVRAALKGKSARIPVPLAYRTLARAFEGALRDVAGSAAEGRLPDDLPALIAANVEKLVGPAAVEDGEQAIPSWFRSHPPPADRIARALARKEPGVVACAAPATALFHDFAELSKERTEEVYRAKFGKSASLRLCPTAELLGRQDAEGLEWNAARRFYLDAVSPLRPPRVRTAAVEAPKDPREAFRRLGRSGEPMDLAKTAYVEALRRDGEASSALARLAEAQTLLRAGLTLDANAFDLPAATREAVTTAQGRLRNERVANEEKLRPFEEAASERLRLAVSILSIPTLAARKEIKEARAEVLLELARRVSIVLPRIDDVREEQAALSALLSQIEDEEDLANDVLMGVVRSRAGSTRKALMSLASAVAGLPYPFEHADPGADLRRYVLDSVPAEEDPSALLGACDGAVERLTSVHFRVLGKLANSVAYVEEMGRRLASRPAGGPSAP